MFFLILSGNPQVPLVTTGTLGAPLTVLKGFVGFLIFQAALLIVMGV